LALAHSPDAVLVLAALCVPDVLSELVGFLLYPELACLSSPTLLSLFVAAWGDGGVAWFQVEWWDLNFEDRSGSLELFPKDKEVRLENTDVTLLYEATSSGMARVVKGFHSFISRLRVQARME